MRFHSATYIPAPRVLRCPGMILALLTALLFSGAKLSPQDGSTAYNYLNVTSSARIYGLGGVNISTVEDELSTADQNPGLLGFEMSDQVLVDYMRYLGNSNFAGVKYARAIGERGAWSAGFRYSYDNTSRLRGGITMKLLYSSYEQYSAFAVATDLGINWYDPETDWSFSAVVANLGGQLKKFHESYDRLPIDVRLGATKGFSGVPVRLSVTPGILRNGNSLIMTAGTALPTSPLRLRNPSAQICSATWSSEWISHLPTASLSRWATTTRPGPT